MESYLNSLCQLNLPFHGLIQTILVMLFATFLIVVTYVTSREKHRQRIQHIIFPGQVLAALNLAGPPFAIFRISDLKICYINRSFAELWGEHITNEMYAQSLWTTTDGELLRALTDVAQDGLRKVIIYRMSTGYDQRVFQAEIDTFEQKPQFVVLIMHDISRL
ncbi:hypothetical protein FO440_21810 [Mucilaginibacter corticis]|uniref:PAS domain-containing protein n=1 Tax=Mucilaginibacter corticis TaxID=2597670 RepID=A0A556M993_9SPHI|nr:hypothetical protein [Mucilaginibacter corticis]TSJ36472.1 hypothetical protein FO440_21810 [Mucilaginibacter corticis]